MLGQEKKDNTAKIDAAKTNNMNKKRIIIITLIIILFLFAFAVLAYFLINDLYQDGDVDRDDLILNQGTPPPADIPSVGIPYSFFVVHIRHKATLDYFYNNLEPLVELAGKYNVKATLQFGPDWVRMLSENEKEKNIVLGWQGQGHEIAVINPGPSHNTWNGYSNLPAEQAEIISYMLGRSSGGIHDYLGSIDGPDGFLKTLEEIASPQEIKSGTFTDKWTDVPEGVPYLTEGINDGRTRKAIKLVWNGHTTYRINMHGLWDSGTLNDAKEKYASLTKDEIYGTVTHHTNFNNDTAFPGGTESIEKWFKHLYEKDPKGDKRKTVAEIMEDYILPNNLIIEGGCGDSVCDSAERENGLCSEDCDSCTFPTDCLICSDPANFCKDDKCTGLESYRKCCAMDKQYNIFFCKNIIDKDLYNHCCRDCSSIRMCEFGNDAAIHEYVFGNKASDIPF